MSDYKERFEKWQKEAREKFEEIDKQLGLKDKIEEGARVVVETAQKSAEMIKDEAEKTEVGKHAVKAAEATIKGAEEAAKKAWQASEPLRDVAEGVGEKASEAAKEVSKKAGEVIEGAFDSASSNAKRVSSVFSFGAAWTRTIDSALTAVSKTSGWIQENPLQAVATGASMAVGAGLGAVLTAASSHWFLNSALPAWTVKRFADQFDSYLKSREELIENGHLDEAEAERVKFERDMARRIGAPLLGAFSFASGAVMMTNVLNPKTITGAPLDWLLGGNPLLEGVWFFGNGMICFKTSYDFFMIALDGQDDVQQIVREIKGLLPDSLAA